MEPTWESMINNNSSYSMFLTPINKLKESFPRDRFRSDIDVLCGTKKINEINLKDKISLYQFFNNKDLNQEYIAIKMQLSGIPMTPSTISKIESDQRAVTDKELMAFSKVLGKTPSDLLFNTTDNFPLILN